MQRVRDELVADASRLRPQRHARRRLLQVALPAAALILVAVVALSLPGRGGETAWAAELVRVAESTPRLLLREEGWEVTRADELSATYGEMTFSNGERELELRWQPAREHAAVVKDRSGSADLRTTAPVEGGEARLFRYADTNDYTAHWVRAGAAIEARGPAADPDEFRATLAALREVDAVTWLSAMPASVVAPVHRAAVVGGMLEGLPLPPGFESAALKRGDAVRDRYQLGAQVVAAVACAWMDRWVAARESGDAAAASRAVEAMATSRSWPVLIEMNEEGDYPEVLWELAGAMATGATVSGGKPLTVEESYASALGCQ